MQLPIDRIKFSQVAKEQLIKPKRVTKIPVWNVICHWVRCRSLAEPMTWQVLGGAIADHLLITLKER